MEGQHLDEKEKQLLRQSQAGDYLLDLRNEKGLSLAKVCKILEISANYLSEIERGLKVPSDHLIRQLADFYDIDEASLFERFGKVPLTVREALENSKSLRKTISEISSSKKLTEEQKQELYDELYRLYKKVLLEQ